jgi:hypothetical protein
VRRSAHRLIVSVLACLLALVGVVGSAHAAVAPVEPYASYQPQTVCSAWDKPGTKALGHWIVASYGGGYGGISRPCTGRSVSEHKEGRAFDWTLNAASATDRSRAARFLHRILMAGPTGEPAELARRMGIMYIIFNDRMYAAYDHFQVKPYLSSACRSLATCSRTLRHRDHLHISLIRTGGLGRTSWYAGRVPTS